jgi:hypothetical protein
MFGQIDEDRLPLASVVHREFDALHLDLSGAPSI